MLRVAININYLHICEIQAVRVRGEAELDSVGTYKISYLEKGVTKELGEVEHRYGDGAVKLAEIMTSYTSKKLDLKIG